LKADFVILDRQFTTGEIDGINVQETWIDGACVYQK
jgi:predicted amidohydrolase YtcJ